MITINAIDRPRVLSFLSLANIHGGLVVQLMSLIEIEKNIVQAVDIRNVKMVTVRNIRLYFSGINMVGLFLLLVDDMILLLFDLIHMLLLYF
jgi:hypothetical protein